MSFDFSLLLPKETVAIGDLQIPKYGSLTPYELKQMQGIETESVIDYQSAIATIMLQSRCNAPDDLCLDDAPIGITRQIYEFAMNELNEWKKPSEDGEKKQPTGENSIGDLGSNIPMPNSGDAQSTSSDQP